MVGLQEPQFGQARRRSGVDRHACDISLAFMLFSGILGGKAVTDRTMINDQPVTGVFRHLPSEAFQVSFEHAFLHDDLHAHAVSLICM